MTETNRWTDSVVRPPYVPDAMVLAIVPTALLAVFTLPEVTRRSLAFHLTDPSVLTAFSGHFVHFSLEHLVVNLLSYCLLVGTGHALAVRGGMQRLFFGALVTFVTVFPVVISLLNLAVPRESITFGFSAINMALAGIIPVLLVEYVGTRADTGVDQRHAPALFFLSLTVISLIAVPLSMLTIAVAVVALGTGMAYATPLRNPVGTADDRAELKRLVACDQLFVVAPGLLVGYLYSGFLGVATGDGQVLNLYSHFLGYSLGFIVAYLSCRLGFLSPGVSNVGSAG